MSKIKREKPKSLKQYVELCERYGGVVITRKHGLKVACCSRELDRFIKKGLKGRTEVPLRDLIPWIRRNHQDWEEVMEVIDAVLIKIGVLSKGYEYDDYIGIPLHRRVSAI